MAAPSSSPVRNVAALRFDLSTGVTIAADAHGNPDAQPVLFLHGGGQTRHAWGSSAQTLAEHGFYAVSMDHRGHGDSSWAPDGDYALSSFVDDLFGVLQQLRRRPVLVGASLGGITSLLAETATDESVAAGLVLVDITPRVEREGVLRILDFMKGSSEGFSSLDEAADAIASYLPHRPRPENLGGLKKNLRLGDDGRYRWHWDPRLLDTWDPDSFTSDEGERIVAERMAAARRLSVPTLLVRGRMSDVVTETQAREFLELVPHAEYVDLAGAAHMVAGDTNDAFTTSVSDFICRHFGRPGD